MQNEPTDSSPIAVHQPNFDQDSSVEVCEHVFIINCVTHSLCHNR